MSLKFNLKTFLQHLIQSLNFWHVSRDVNTDIYIIYNFFKNLTYFYNVTFSTEECACHLLSKDNSFAPT